MISLALDVGGGGTGVPLRELALVGLTAAGVTYLITSLVRVFAVKAGAVAVPRERDVHVIPTPGSAASACSSAWRARSVSPHSYPP